MQTWYQDEFFSALSDVENVLENVNIDDLAFWLVKEMPVLADKLQTALGFHLLDKEIVVNE